ncbi:MAG: hypothetical protein V7L04_09950 [Nostoc sp.]|uniref:hypothetical protein n=1 Tax=Nostoc sp. TaxID=1180 RepID=UPI002FF62403
MANGALGMGKMRDSGSQGVREERITMPNTSASLRDATRTLSTSAQCPMPNAQCPMPNAQCPMPNAQLSRV